MDPDTRRAIKRAVQQPSTRERLEAFARKMLARIEALEAAKEVEEALRDGKIKGAPARRIVRAIRRARGVEDGAA